MTQVNSVNYEFSTKYLNIPFQTKTDRREMFACVPHNCADKNDIENRRYYSKKMQKEDEGKHFKSFLIILC